MPEPLISVVLPTHNRAALLRRSLASVLAQTHRNLELIVVNDASTDETIATLDAVRDPRLRVITRRQSSGAAAARNAGIAVACGQYVAFQDDDDIWLAQKLERQLYALRSRPDAEWCIGCHIRLEPLAVRYIGGEWFIRQFDYREGAGVRRPDWSLIATPGWLLQRAALEAVGGFDERIRSYDDWELGLRLFRRAAPVIVDEPLWWQDRWSGSGLIRQSRSRAQDLRIIMERHGQFWATRPDVRARHWRMSGRILSLEDPAPAGRAELKQALREQPFSVSSWLALAASYLGREWNRRLTSLFRALRGALP
ncbi:MAG TPA: glycosyltransferase family A protein [Nevskiales bacterium]|nr:glycosyltransferase family A protein [Nevskiales bacterium]